MLKFLISTFLLVTICLNCERIKEFSVVCMKFGFHFFPFIPYYPSPLILFVAMFGY